MLHTKQEANFTDQKQTIVSRRRWPKIITNVSMAEQMATSTV